MQTETFFRLLFLLPFHPFFFASAAILQLSFIFSILSQRRRLQYRGREDCNLNFPLSLAVSTGMMRKIFRKRYPGRVGKWWQTFFVALRCTVISRNIPTRPGRQTKKLHQQIKAWQSCIHWREGENATFNGYPIIALFTRLLIFKAMAKLFSRINYRWIVLDTSSQTDNTSSLQNFPLSCGGDDTQLPFFIRIIHLKSETFFPLSAFAVWCERED